MSAGIGPEHALRAYAVPITPRPFRLTVGVRPTTHWLLSGPDADDQLRLKAHLLTRRRDEVLAVDDGCHREVASLTTLLRAERGGAGQSGQGRQPAADGQGEPSAGDVVEDFAAVTAITQEDVCLLRRSATGGAWRLQAASVCFPSHWRLAEKMGHDLDAIHRPVPGYDQRLAVATRTFFDRAAAADSGGGPGIWERFNWTLTGTDELFCPGPSQPLTIAPEELGTHLWLRTERQTVRRVPGCADAVVFTIRTFLTGLAELTADERHALAVSLAGVSPEMARYRGTVGYREVVQEWLRSPGRM